MCFCLQMYKLAKFYIKFLKYDARNITREILYAFDTEVFEMRFINSFNKNHKKIGKKSLCYWLNSTTVIINIVFEKIYLLFSPSAEGGFVF